MASGVVTTPTAWPGPLRRALGLTLLAAIGGVVLAQLFLYRANWVVNRPHDFLQVWSAGRLAMAGENPYDSEKMLALQVANGAPRPSASMMWVPPWGVALALPIGALPVPLAEGVWISGQLALILFSVLILWRLNGGQADRSWVPLSLALAFGPVWCQVVFGQYAGVLLFGMVGFLAAHRANRPVLAGLSLTLIALKPHLFIPLAVGFLIDGMRTTFGRRVLLGGMIGLGIGALAVTLVAPSIWTEYIAAMMGERSAHALSIRDWFNPTIPAWIRFFVPGRPFWVQTLPAGLAAIAFSAYWWRTGHPSRWPKVVNWAIPIGLLVAPYGCWQFDLTLLLVPTVALAARADARGWTFPGRFRLAAAYLFTNVAVLPIYPINGTSPFVWVAPVLCGCLLWLWKEVKAESGYPSTAQASTNRLHPVPAGL